MDKINSKKIAYSLSIIMAIVMMVLSIAVYFNSFLTLLIFCLAILAIIFAWKPEIGIYSIALFLPLINFNFNIGWMIIPFIDAVAIVSLIGFAIHLIIHLEKVEKLKFPLLIPFLFFWLATIASAFFSPDIKSSVWYSVRWILFFYIAYIWLPVNIIKDEKILKRVLISFVVSGIIMGIFGIVSLKDQNISYDPIRFTVLTINGQKPFGIDQNLLVETLLPSIFFLLALGSFWFKKAINKKIIMLGSLFMIFVLLGTFSRGAWISLIICILAYVIIGSKASFKQIILVTLISLLLLSPLFIYMFNLQTSYEVGVGSTKTRLLSTQIAWNNFTESPIFGKGTGRYVDLINRNIRFRAQHGEGTDSNGVFQKVMAENGAVGLITFFFMAFYIFFNLYKDVIKMKKNSNHYLLPVVLGALSIFIFEFFNTSYYHGKMWVPIAIAWSAMLIEKKQEYGKK